MGRHVEISRADDRTTIVRLGGTWRLEDGLPTPAELDREIEKAAGTSRVRFEADRLESWDSSLVTFVVGLSEGCLGRGASIGSGGLPEGIRRLLALGSSTSPTGQLLPEDVFLPGPPALERPFRQFEDFGHERDCGRAVRRELG
jgi:hypothetical protein